MTYMYHEDKVQSNFESLILGTLKRFIERVKASGRHL